MEGHVTRSIIKAAARCFWTGVVCVFAGVAPVQAQVDGLHFTVEPFAGYGTWAEGVNVADSFIGGGKVGLWANGFLGLEAVYGISPTETIRGSMKYTPSLYSVDTAVWDEMDLKSYGANLIAKLFPSARFTPYFLAGWHEQEFPAVGLMNDKSYVNGPQAGVGLLWWVAPRIALKPEVRDWMWSYDSPPAPGDPGDDLRHNFTYSVGLSFAIGGWQAGADTDKDGVRDRRDMCPDTPLGARVDAGGCPLDADKDGVFDGLDRCDATPIGATVNTDGCPKDSDNDGVFDGLDQCANTPAGSRVDSKGCPLDSDGDGVADGVDQCDNTPTGATVDANGCPKDSDRDGVFDGIDLCANTPSGVRVDAQGCPIEVSEREIELLDTGKITARNINFQTGKWALMPSSHAVLDGIGQVLVQWPELRIEIGGHTDAVGSDASNQTLSEKRATSVRDYLMGRFPQITGEQYTIKGYGETQPVASNDTVEGKAQNRRVEFKVLNSEVLQKVREQRKLLRK